VTNSKISDLELDQLIEKAVKGDKVALGLLLFHPWLTERLDKISARKAYKFRLDREEIRDAVFDTVSRKIQDIKNPKNRPLTKCLNAWCGSIAESVSLNMLRHAGTERKYIKREVRESTNGGRKTAEGISQPLQFKSPKTPEENYVEKEMTELCAELWPLLLSRVQQELKSLSPEDTRLLKNWSGKTLRELKEETGIPIATLNRHLKDLQKDLLKKLRIYEVVKKDPKHWKTFAGLMRNSIKTMTHAA